LTSLWEELSDEGLDLLHSMPKPEPIPFDAENFAPLTFHPADRVIVAVDRARQALSNKNNCQCIKIAEEIAHLTLIIEGLEREGSVYQQADMNKEWQLSARALFTWMDAFDSYGMSIKDVEWYEVFAVKVLMLCAAYTKKIAGIKDLITATEYNLLSHTQSFTLEQLLLEIVDCLARCETLQKRSGVKTSAKLLGSKGGKGRTAKQEPLRRAVIQMYLKEYSNMPVLKAANCIQVVLESERPDLLLLTTGKNKAVAIQNIIKKFRQERAEA
jgi:hypothetical protein